MKYRDFTIQKSSNHYNIKLPKHIANNVIYMRCCSAEGCKSIIDNWYKLYGSTL